MAPRYPEHRLTFFLRRHGRVLGTSAVAWFGIWLGISSASGALFKYPELFIGITAAVPVIFYIAGRLSYERLFHVMVFTLPFLAGFVVDIGGSLRIPWVLSVLAFCAGLYQKKLRKIPRDPATQLILLFVLYAVLTVGLTLGVDMSAPMEDSGLRLTPYRSFVQAGQLILMLMAFYLTLNYVTSMERLRKVTNLIFWSTLIVALYGIYDFSATLFNFPFVSVITDTSYYKGGAADNPFVNIGGISLPRPRSVLPEPMDLSIFLLFSIPYAVETAFGERRRWARWFKAACVIVFLLLFFIANSRAGLAALGVVLVLLWSLVGGIAARVRLIAAGALVYLIVAFVVLPVAGGESGIASPVKFYQERLLTLTKIEASIRGTEESTTIGRRYDNQIAVFSRHPIFGVGLGNYSFYYLREAGEIVVASTFSLYLRLLTELGLIGTSLFLLFVGRIAWVLLRVIRSTSDPLLRRFALASLLGIVGVMIARIGLDGLCTDSYMWVMLALGLSVSKLGHRSAAVVEDAWRISASRSTL